MKNAAEVVNNYIQTHFFKNIDKGLFGNTTALISDGLMDSIEILQLVDFLRQHFEIEIEAYDISISNFDSVNSIVGYIENKKRSGE